MLFGNGLVPLAQRKDMLADRRSVLDAVLKDAGSLDKQVSRTDKDKMEEYFTSIRDLEKRLEKERM